jgi:predicted regulator of Ras-like GTPase activity (Roadblock/LC7/MglB family)
MARLDRILADLFVQVPEIEAAAVVSFDGLAMASALPVGMDEDRVAAMSAALLSLGEKAAEGLGRGDLSQVYVEGEHGTVFLVSAQDEAVLVAVAAARAKTGLVLFEIRRAASHVANVLADDAGSFAPQAPAMVVDLAVVPDLAPEPDPLPSPTHEPVPEPLVQATLEPEPVAPPEPAVADLPLVGELPAPVFPPPVPQTPWPPLPPQAVEQTASNGSAVVLPGSTQATAAGLAAGFAGAPSDLTWSPAPLDDFPDDPWNR